MVHETNPKGNTVSNDIKTSNFPFNPYAQYPLNIKSIYERTLVTAIKKNHCNKLVMEMRILKNS